MATKTRIRSAVRVNVYRVISEAVEIGTGRGWRRAHKHADDPGEDAIVTEIHNAVLTELCEVLDFD